VPPENEERFEKAIKLPLQALSRFSFPSPFYAIVSRPVELDGHGNLTLRRWVVQFQVRDDADPTVVRAQTTELLSALDEFRTVSDADSQEIIWPTTLSEAVDEVLRLINEDTKALLKGMDDDGLVGIHHTMGAGIRTGFGLWGGNAALLGACGTSEPDDASTVILKAVRDRLRE